MSSEKSVQSVERSPALDELLRGAREIGAYAGEKPDAIYHIVKTKKNKKKKPLADAIGNCGGELISTKSKIDRALREMAK
jgi:hypothetical protein